MPLSDQEKTEARDAIALALELNEPETMIEGLRRLCARKAGDRLISDNERERWRNAFGALHDVSRALDRANAPQTRASDEQGEQDTPNAA